MEFTISTVGRTYRLKEANKLKELGFTFKSIKDSFLFLIVVSRVTIKIKSLQELAELSKKYGDMIVSGDHITIYDDYLE